MLQKPKLQINWNLMQGELITVHMIVWWFRSDISPGKPDQRPPRKTARICGKFDERVTNYADCRLRNGFQTFLMLSTRYLSKFLLRKSNQFISLACYRPIHRWDKNFFLDLISCLCTVLFKSTIFMMYHLLVPQENILRDFRTLLVKFDFHDVPFTCADRKYFRVLSLFVKFDNDLVSTFLKRLEEIVCKELFHLSFF